MTDVTTLPETCATEIAALPPFANYDEATRVINGQLGISVGVRGKYLRKLYAAASAQKLSDVMVRNVGAAISLACDRAIALKAEVSDRSNRRIFVPTDVLTQDEKDALYGS